MILKSNSQGAGNSYGTGPTAASKSERDSGWDFKKISHWDFTEGRVPA